MSSFLNEPLKKMAEEESRLQETAEMAAVIASGFTRNLSTAPTPETIDLIAEQSIALARAIIMKLKA